uniref:Pin2-interacting protein X1 n=1 Tax=Rhipicephalus zambeziensis TaxID=60191 RepID=A0A224YVZ6_9ACAR
MTVSKPYTKLPHRVPSFTLKMVYLGRSKESRGTSHVIVVKVRRSRLSHPLRSGPWTRRFLGNGKKSKRRAENIAENDEQDAPEATVSQMDFHAENSAPQAKKKSKLKPDHCSISQRLQANGSEQWDEEDCLNETDPSSTKHSVREDVPKQTKKPKRQPSPSTDGSLKPQTATVFPSTEFCSVEQQQVKKKSKHRPTPSVAEQEPRKTSSRKAAVTDLKDRAAKKEALLTVSEPCLEEEMPQRATRKPKLKASKVLDETGELKGHTESAEDTTGADRCYGKTSPSASGQCEAVFKQRGQSKKLKHDPADEEDEQVRERGTSKAVVLDANTEELSKDCELRKPKRKQEKKEKKGAAELDAKAKARKGSSQLQEVAAKKGEQEQEQNDEYENQIGGAHVKTKTVPKQKLKEDASSSERNPQQEQTNENTKGNKRPKQGLEGTAAPKKHRSEQVVETSNTPLKKLKEGEKSSGSKLKQKEGTTTKPVVKKHAKDASKLAAKNSEATATKPVSEEPVLGPRPTFVPGNRQRNTRAGNAASTHGKGHHPSPVACSLDKLERGIWTHYFEPNVNVRAIDSDDTAASMAQWVVDTVENSGGKVTPYKACHLDKEMYAMMLSDHIYRWHSTSNWMQIPGYGSDFWVQGVVNNLVSKMLLKRQKDASSSASRVVE